MKKTSSPVLVTGALITSVLSTALLLGHRDSNYAWVSAGDFNYIFIRIALSIASLAIFIIAAAKIGGDESSDWTAPVALALSAYPLIASII